MKYALIAIALLLVILIAGAIGGTLWFNQFLRGPVFLALVSGKVGDATKSKADVAALQWTGSSAFSERATLQGFPQGAIEFLDAREVRAEWNWRAVFSGSWRVEDVTIAALDARMALPQRTAAPAASSEATPVLDVVEPTSGSGSPGRLPSWLPQRFELGGVRVNQANISMGPLNTKDTALTMAPLENGWRLQARGGTIESPVLPALKLQSATLLLRPNGIFLNDATAELGTGGLVSASGEPSKLIQFQWEKIHSTDVLPAAWKNTIEGVLSGSGTVAEGKVSGQFRVTDARLQKWPMLDQIATFTGNPTFRSLPVQEISAKFALEGSDWTFSQAVIESKGLVKMEGSATVKKDGSLTGDFQVGVTPQTLQWIPGSKEKVFTVSRDGYLWTKVTFGGTIDKPTEDLTPRLVAAAASSAVEAVVPVLKSAPEASQKAAGEAVNAIRQLFNY